MSTRRHRCLLSFLLALGFSACSGDDQTILLVNIEQGTMSTPPTTIAIHAYKMEQGTRVKVGSSTGIAWTDAKKGLGLKMAESAAGAIFIEGVGSPSGVADPVPATVVAKASNGPIRLVFRDGVVGNTDGGALDGGELDSGASNGVDGGGEVTPTPTLDARPRDADQPGEAAPPVDGGPDGPTADTPGAALDAAPDAEPDAPVPTPDLGDKETQRVDVALPDTARDTESIDTAVDRGSSMGFTPVQAIETIPQWVSSPAVAVDPVRGHVYVAWVEDVIIKVKRWSRTTATWGTTQNLIVSGATPGARSVRIGVDGTGRVHVLWFMDRDSDDPLLGGVWASQAGPGEVLSLSPPQKIVSVTVDQFVYRLEMGVASAGVVYLVCALQERDSPNYTSVYTASFDGNTWTTNPQSVYTPDSIADREPSLAVSDMGTAMLMLDRSSTGVKRTATFLLSGTSRKDTGDLDPAATVAVDSRVISANRQGEFAVAWLRSSTWESYVAKYNPQTGWTPATVLTNGYWQDYPAAVLSDDGTITVAYAKKVGGTFNLAAQTGKLTEGMGQPVQLETDNKSVIAFGGDAYEYSLPRMAVDSAGNVLLVFRKQESDTTSSLWGTRLEKGAWRTPVLVARVDKMHAVFPSLDVADSGFAAFAFRYWDTAKPATLADGHTMFVGFFE